MIILEKLLFWKNNYFQNGALCGKALTEKRLNSYNSGSLPLKDCKCTKQVSKLIPNGGGAVCISNSNKKKPTWRIFCDDNGNDDFDNGEDFQDIQNKCKKLKSTLSC